jgi:tetratricopeptide (TPR) repeat protein
LAELPDKLGGLIRVDIEALRELSENLAFCLDAQGRTEEGIQLFRHLRQTVKLPGFAKRMSFMEALWYDAKLGDRSKAQEALSGTDIDHEDDPDVIQLYLQVFDVPPAQTVSLIERILDGTNLPSVALHYSALKSICLHMEGRDGEATEVICSAIDQYAIDPEHVPDLYYMHVCGRAYALKWRLTQDEAVFLKALAYYKALKYDEFTPSGKAHLYAEIAELYSGHGDYTKAAKYYRLSLKAEKSEVATIHLSECCTHRSRLKEAMKLLRSLSFEQLPETLRLEFLGACAALAIKTSDKELADDTMRKLDLLAPHHEYFERQRAEMSRELKEKFPSGEPTRVGQQEVNRTKWANSGEFG